MIEPVLFIDEQAAIAQVFCENCGGCCYAPGFSCLRCERGLKYDAERIKSLL